MNTDGLRNKYCYLIMYYDISRIDIRCGYCRVKFYLIVTDHLNYLFHAFFLYVHYLN